MVSAISYLKASVSKWLLKSGIGASLLIKSTSTKFSCDPNEDDCTVPDVDEIAKDIAEASTEMVETGGINAVETATDVADSDAVITGMEIGKTAIDFVIAGTEMVETGGINAVETATDVANSDTVITGMDIIETRTAVDEICTDGGARPT